MSCFTRVIHLHSELSSGADQGFSEEGAPTLQEGRQHTKLPGFPQKLYEIKKILVHEGGALGRPFDPPLQFYFRVRLYEVLLLEKKQ